MIDVDRVEFAGTMAIDSFLDTGDELFQLDSVVVRHYHQARSLSLLLHGHECEATQAKLSAADPGGRIAVLLRSIPAVSWSHADPPPCLASAARIVRYLLCLSGARQT